MPSIQIIIVAAGSGIRYGSPLPKQFCDMDGRPVAMHTIDGFRRLLPDSEIVIVINPTMLDTWTGLCRRHEFDSPPIVFGGKTRWESVRNALHGCSRSSDITMIHDAVRPIVDDGMIERVINGFDLRGIVDGVIPVIDVTDSLRLVGTDGSSERLDRSRLKAVQTPQAFRSDRLRMAYALPYDPTFTDDASVMEAAGYKHLTLVEGCTNNIKITNHGDIEIASILLKRLRSQ